MISAAELRDVTKSFRGRIVLDKINLTIHQGEILALLGPNGSGKTTLLKILAFIEKPSKGEIKFQGEIVTDNNAERMRMQSTMVFQKTALFSTTVYNNVGYGLKLRRTPKSKLDSEVKKALSLVKLDGFEKRLAKKLSGGEQQRVALARALALNTKVLLLDEPTANLDPKNAAIIEEVIAVANRELKTTIVIATHNMFQAKSLPHRIALMSEGRITEVGAPAEIFGKLSKNLASFAAVDNTFTGTAKATEAGTTMVDIGNGVQIEVTVQRQGATAVFVNPQDIILSKSAVKSSARNVFKGRITEILDLDALVKLKVDAGKPFMIQITKRSFSEMALNLNAEVFITFKASSVHVV
ncbi:MAG: ABC transporter ATP-binding protein [Candidatus Bathyarchaeota archaeon]|nr:MAG: ABC transporter ATP-binding protein [Candidatus Bathyarchaeota archaeon]